MKHIWVVLFIGWGAQAASIPTIAGVLSIAASSGTIIREGHDLFRHPWRTLKQHGAQIKAAAKGKPVPPAATGDRSAHRWGTPGPVGPQCCMVVPPCCVANTDGLDPEKENK